MEYRVSFSQTNWLEKLLPMMDSVLNKKSGSSIFQALLELDIETKNLSVTDLKYATTIHQSISSHRNQVKEYKKQL